RYEAVLEAWEERGARSDEAGRELDERRAEYERGLSVMELALPVKGNVNGGGNGDLDALRVEYRQAEDDYVESERLHEEKRAPFEEARRAAERRYEEERAKYVAAVEDIREQLQKAPQEYEARYKEILEKYRATCAEEHNKVVEIGGLHILGTERHEARRIDNQLRGRAGRQGDPGSSRFYLSLEDDLMRIFAKAWVSTLLQRLGMEEGVPIESGMISRRIEAAQKAVEAQNFESRKHVLEYDDVMNKQREAVYGLRRQLMEGVDQKQLITDDYLSTILSGVLDEHAPEKVHADEWKLEPLFAQVYDLFGAHLEKEIDATQLNRHELGEAICEKLRARYDIKEQN